MSETPAVPKTRVLEGKTLPEIIQALAEAGAQMHAIGDETRSMAFRSLHNRMVEFVQALNLAFDYYEYVNDDTEVEAALKAYVEKMEAASDAAANGEKPGLSVVQEPGGEAKEATDADGEEPSVEGDTNADCD